MGLLLILNCITRDNDFIYLLKWRIEMDQHPLKNVNNCWNTSIYSHLETSGDQSSHLYLNPFHFLTAILISHLTSVAALDSCFLPLVSNECWSIGCHMICQIETLPIPFFRLAFWVRGVSIMMPWLG